MNEDKACTCPCFCDPTVPRQFEQTAARFNEGAAFAANARIEAFVNAAQQYTAVAVEAIHNSGIASTILALNAIQNQPS